MNMPKIKFQSSVTEQDLLKMETENKNKVQRFFEPGNYSLKVVDLVHNKTDRNPEGTASGDPSWLVFKLVLGGLDDRTINNYTLVPTQTLEYKKPGMKQPLMMIGKLREFLRGVGYDPTAENLANAVSNIIGAPESFKGIEVNVTIGHRGRYIKYNPEDKSYSIVSRKGENLFPDRSYSDRNSALADAAELGLDVEQLQRSFPEVTRIHPKEKEVTEKGGW